jgi:hypothetical protein
VKRTLWVVALLVATMAGCPPRQLANTRNDEAMVIQSVDAYAKKHGLAREEAARELRAKADQAAAQEKAQPGH